MANNGFLSSGSCLSPAQYSLNYCTSQLQTGDLISSASFALNASGTPSYASCQIKRGTSYIYPSISLPAFDCDTSLSLPKDQVLAVNSVFAVSLAALAVIWGARKIYELLISNPRTE